MTGAVRIALVLAVAAAATIIANLVLLGVATGPQDSVGRLSPPPAAAAVQRAPATPRTVLPPAPVSHGHEREPQDD